MRRLIFAAAFAMIAGGALAAQFGDSQYPIRADDGDEIANFTLSAEQAAQLAKLQGIIPVGNLNGDVTLLQFYDLNCPFCREAAADVHALVRSDPKLKLVFVPYAVLSVQSVQGALIELGAAKLATPAQYLEFHRRIYAGGRGLIDGPRTLAAAKDAGIDPQKAAAAGNTEASLNLLRQNADFGSAAKLVATPAYVIAGVAVLGHPGLNPLKKMVAAVRACGKVVC